MPNPATELELVSQSPTSATLDANGFPCLKEARVRAGEALGTTLLRIGLAGHQPAPPPFERALEPLRAHETLVVELREFCLPLSLLTGRTESTTVEVLAELVDGDGAVLAHAATRLEVQPATHWDGNWGGVESIAAFVTPNAPQLVELLRDAAGRLGERTGSDAIDGYQSGSADRAQRIAEACSEALAARVHNYTEGRVGFEGSGQRVRTAGEVVAEAMGNCLDLACACAALFELAGLHPLLVLGEGHAIVGFFTIDERFAEPVHMGTSRVRNRLALGELRVLDATGLAGASASFGRALEAGERWLAARGESIWVVDVTACRAARIRPFADQLQAGGVREALRREPQATEWNVVQPIRVERAPRAPLSYKEQRLATWMKRLLDLTLRNRLLNDRFADSGVPLLLEGDDALALLEDKLWDERKLRLLPRAPSVGAIDLAGVRDELGAGWLTTALPEPELYARATRAYREGRSSVEETGARSLFVALGFLRYTVEGRKSDLMAPLLMVPVELERISRSEGYAVRPLPDDTVVNAALAEFVRQVHGVDLGLESALPEDRTGLDVQRVLAGVRQAVREIPGCTVEARAKLGTWAFKKMPLVEELRLRGAAMMEHRLVATLLERKSSQGGEARLPGPTDVERLGTRSELRLPLPADSSQVAAILAATAEHTFVLQGPPGTGKSQTITNLLSESIARGKRVLFLAEKSAALDVVARRLERTGLGVYALNLHPERASKSGFVAQVKEALDNLDSSAAAHSRRFAEKGAAFDEASRKLARVCELLHAGADGEVTLHAALDAAATARLALGSGAPRLDGALAVPLAAAALEELEERGRRLGQAWQQVPLESGKALDDMDNLAPLSPEAEREGAAALEALAADLSLAQEAGAALAQALGCPAPMDAGAARRLAEVARFASDEHATTPALVAALCSASAGLELDALEAALELEAGAQAARARFDEHFESEALDLPGAALLAELRASREQFFVSAWLARRRVRRQLVPLARSVPGKDLESLLACVQVLVDTRTALDSVAPRAELVARLRGSATRLDVAEARRRLTLARTLLQEARQSAPELLPALAPKLPALAGSAVVAGLVAALDLPLGRVDAARARTLAALGLEELAPLPFAAERERATRWLAVRQDWDVWSLYAAERRDARRRGLAPLAQALQVGSIAPGRTDVAAVGGALQGWLEARLRRELELGQCTGERAEELRRRLRECASSYSEGVADAVDTLARDRARDALRRADADPQRASCVRELRRLQTLSTVRRSLRRLMRETGAVLVDLKPIVLASPLSAANHLPPDFPQFDLVVIDEASQVPVWDAACALSRARDAVVVGDSKQLPPTSFFDRREGGDDDELSDDSEAIESVLDGCVNAGLPQLSLLWHYRSRDERLIEFANRRSYGARLQTFPAPHGAHPNLGVEFRLVAGTYDRSGTRTNRAEAEAVVAEIVRRLSDAEACPAHRSIGVVTFSVAQQQLVQDLLDAALDSNPTAASGAAQALERGEGVFVKNLESVQGDERATMLFSVGYGPDAEGRIHYNFGPLSASGGERRLNVAITRAREKVVVFASMRSSQLDPARCRAQGVSDLRGYLEYAELGALPATDEGVARRTVGVTGIERELAARLERLGWHVDLHVGRSRDYRISLALAERDRPGSWKLGVELDGAHWAAAPTTLDRELVRTGVLESLGWRILRVASLDAWRDPERTARRIDEAARAAPR